ncbi:bifunctional adenosylcobinamide kinase/adenosylcobinamide-phosphate guanylyltransferase [Vibrio metoecus]|uniref:bifunctional adenosylcobinamide kinase/adenosylcobinamide-phosphate guanylyltransferase n=1 Tax=Vibrio metoecus TaxID=1481663 RepID=UPI0001B99298|nr:bifunctional adenosylcobinamide kinase/adenosylcobinamide-phosphate guanylyltransferase [Vibrio metoecus]EEX66613.1 adenosylcobinamide-phosphate guanylyltransferase [Vibrio metoecus]
MSVHLILGGARSGKSSYAEQLARQTAQSQTARLHYVATATALDDEMRARIAHHQARRTTDWTEHEVPLALADYLSRFQRHDVVLVDCLTLWLNNQLFEHEQSLSSILIDQLVEQLLVTLTQTQAQIFLVSNEVGMGVVPMGELTRFFVDHAGWMNQKIAALADSVTFVVAGLPQRLKGE